MLYTYTCTRLGMPATTKTLHVETETCATDKSFDNTIIIVPMCDVSSTLKSTPTRLSRPYANWISSIGSRKKIYTHKIYTYNTHIHMEKKHNRRKNSLTVHYLLCGAYTLLRDSEPYAFLSNCSRHPLLYLHLYFKTYVCARACFVYGNIRVDFFSRLSSRQQRRMRVTSFLRR